MGETVKLVERLRAYAQHPQLAHFSDDLRQAAEALSPAVRVTREEVAAIVCERKRAFATLPDGSYRYPYDVDRTIALAKADQILALLGKGEEKGSSGAERAASPNACGLGTAGASHCQSEWEEVIRLAEVGEYLYEACSYSYGDGHSHPREFGIAWDWQQSKPDQYGQGILLADATAWHDAQAEDGTITEARRLRALLSASPPAPVSSGGGGWEPIETAEPVEGKSIIVQTADDPPIVGEAWWKLDGDHLDLWWANTGPGDYYADPISQTNARVTHWRPLPDAAPVNDPAEGGV